MPVENLQLFKMVLGSLAVSQRESIIGGGSSASSGRSAAKLTSFTYQGLEGSEHCISIKLRTNSLKYVKYDIAFVDRNKLLHNFCTRVVRAFMAAHFFIDICLALSVNATWRSLCWTPSCESIVYAHPFILPCAVLPSAHPSELLRSPAHGADARGSPSSLPSLLPIIREHTLW